MPLNRRFTGGTHPHGTRRFAPRAAQHLVRSFAGGDISKVMSDEIRQPRRAHDPSFCQLRVLALGYGALRPSCRSTPGAASYSARLNALDTLGASAAANGGYRPCAVHFSIGHGAVLRSTLRAQLLMRIRMAVLRPLALLWIPHTRTARSARFAFQRRAVVRMTNLCDGISKSSAAACYTDLRVCLTCVQRLSGHLVTPFDCVFFSLFSPKLYSLLPKSRQRVITRFCPTSPTIEATQRFRSTLLTTFCTAPATQIFAGVPPNNKF